MHTLTKTLLGCLIVGGNSLISIPTAQAFNFGNMMNPERFFDSRKADNRYYDQPYQGGGYGAYPNGYGYRGYNPGYGAYPPTYPYPPAAYAPAPYPAAPVAPAAVVAPQPAVSTTYTSPPQQGYSNATPSLPQTAPPVYPSTYSSSNAQGTGSYGMSGQMSLQGGGQQSGYHTGASNSAPPAYGQAMPGYINDPRLATHDGFSPLNDEHPPLPPLSNSSAPATAYPQTGVGYEPNATNNSQASQANTYPAPPTFPQR